MATNDRISKTSVKILSTLVLTLLITFFGARPVFAEQQIVFGTQWFAEAQQGGFYEALALGIYKKYGLNVKIVSGGPGISGQQLLADGRYQFYQGRGINQLVALMHGLPLITVAAFFQRSPDCIYAHDNVKTPFDLSDRKYKILVAADDRQSWWPWAMRKFGYKTSQLGVYTGSIVPFLSEKNIAQQGYYGAEDFMIRKSGIKFKTFLLTNYGYPEYSGTIQTTDAMVMQHPTVVARFVEASLLGWKEYFKNPAPANHLIMMVNPKQTQEQLIYGLKIMKKGRLLKNLLTKTTGIGAMSDRRWRKIFQLAVENHLVSKNLDWKKAFTLKFVDRTHIHIKS